MDTKTAFYISAGVGLLGAVLAFTIQGGGLMAILGGIISALGAAGAMAIYKYGYMLIPMLTSTSKTVVVTTDGYEIPPTQDAVVKKTKEGVYYASVFLTMKLYQSAVEMTEEQLRAYNKAFETAMAGFKGVVKIAYMLHAVDVSDKKRELETKKAEAQLRLQREREKTEPDPLRIERYEREVMYWNAQIDKLSRGLRPMRVVLYAMTTAAGLTREEALAKARNQAAELRTLLSNALNCEVYVLAADDLMRVLEWEKFMPTSAEELEENLETEGSSNM